MQPFATATWAPAPIRLPKPSAGKEIVTRLRQDWPGGTEVVAGKVKPSDVATWLAGYDFGWASQHLYLECIRAIFDLAVADGVIVENPARAATVKRMKKEKPMRLPPTSEEFQRIVADIRSQEHNADAGESADFIEFLGLAGLGQAEAGSLRWCDIDWDAELVSTFRHKTRSRFCFPLYPQLRPLLERRKAGHESTTDQKVFRIRMPRRRSPHLANAWNCLPSARDPFAACLSPGPSRKAWMQRPFQNGRVIRTAEN